LTGRNVMSEPDELARIEGVRRLARQKQKELAGCQDPHRRIVLLRERNELLRRLKALSKRSTAGRD
jgi:hypothetical protein